MNRPAILCVDDDKDVLDALFNLLLDEFNDEYDIELAEAGEEALEIIEGCLTENIEIPLIISDYFMPGMKGDELLITLHAKQPHIIKILLTGQATLEGVKKAYEYANLYRYITKPWEKHDLLLAIREGLNSYYVKKNLNNAEKKYKRIFDNAVEGIIQTSIYGDIIVGNPALARILGYESAKECLKSVKNIIEIYQNPEDRDKLITELLLKKGVVEFECKLLKKNGNLIWAEINASPVFNENNEIEILESFVRDITEKKKAQEELEQYQKHLENIIEIRTEEIRKKNNEILEINKELKRLSITDRLTGLYNRHKLDDALNNEYERALRYNNIFSLILVDIDKFKTVNDTYGHQVGDRVLIQIAMILKDNTRKVDVVGRWGGEEFIIICPETNMNGARVIAEKIRRKVERFDFYIIGKRTISLGVVSYQQGEKMENIIKRADDCLYSAKKNGRNRIECNL